MTTYLMNPATGSVDTAENWSAEGHTVENANLVEVVKDENGDWAEPTPSLFDEIWQAWVTACEQFTNNPEITLVMTEEARDMLIAEAHNWLGYATRPEGVAESLLGMEVRVEPLPRGRKFELQVITRGN